MLVGSGLAIALLLSLWSSVSVGENSNSTGNYRNYTGYQLLRLLPQSTLEQSLIANMVAQLSPPRAPHDPQYRPIRVVYLPREPRQPIDMFVGPEVRNAVLESLQSDRIDYRVQLDDVGQAVTRGNAPPQRPAHPELVGGGGGGRRGGTAWQLLEEGNNATGSLFDFNTYHSHEEINAYLEWLAKQHPDFVEVASMGRSHEKRDMKYIRLGYPIATNSPPASPLAGQPAAVNGSRHRIAAKPAMFIDAGIHAREWIAPATALHFVNRLVSDVKLRPLLERIDVYVLPVVNPDGYEFSRTDDRLWRGTRSGPLRNCYGADPNRNFPYKWGSVGSSSQPCTETYRGRTPLSEVECRQLANFLANKGPKELRAYVTLHSYGNLLIHPWGYRRHSYPEDVSELLRVGSRANEAIVAAGGPAYQVGSASDILYEASGASDDYAKSLGIKYVYTMELTNTPYTFLLPPELIESTARPAVEALLVVANEVANEGK